MRPHHALFAQRAHNSSRQVHLPVNDPNQILRPGRADDAFAPTAAPPTCCTAMLCE